VVPADRRLESVRDGHVDILCDPTTITLARREIVDFSLPTFLDGASVLTRQGKAISRFEDLAGRKIGVLTGTTSERVLRDSLRKLGVKATVVAVKDHRDGLELVLKDEVNAYFADRGIIAAVLREGDLPGLELSRPLFSYETYALALPVNDDAFRLLVDKTLARLYRSGQINAILTKTFGRPLIDEMLKAMFVINALPEN
jgi:ABC-type amino acid transport substrate-binding protein